MADRRFDVKVNLEIVETTGGTKTPFASAPVLYSDCSLQTMLGIEAVMLGAVQQLHAIACEACIASGQGEQLKKMLKK